MAVGKPGKLGVLRREVGLEECETWAQLIAEEVLIEGRPLAQTLRNAKHSSKIELRSHE